VLRSCIQHMAKRTVMPTMISPALHLLCGIRSLDRGSRRRQRSRGSAPCTETDSCCTQQPIDSFFMTIPFRWVSCLPNERPSYEFPCAADALYTERVEHACDNQGDQDTRSQVRQFLDLAEPRANIGWSFMSALMLKADGCRTLPRGAFLLLRPSDWELRRGPA
jgi:hypothetical protein